MFEKFIADQVKNILTNYRSRFVQWLETSDVDENGMKDREQMLRDFDKLADGVQQISRGGMDLFNLCASYYEKYGKEMVEGSDADNAALKDDSDRHAAKNALEQSDKDDRKPQSEGSDNLADERPAKKVSKDAA